MGTPEFAVPTLELLAGKHDIAAAFSQPPRPSGRGMKTRPSTVQNAAERLDIPVFTPAKLDAGDVARLKELSPDFLVVVAYGLILPEAVLAVPGKAAINGHASLLPRWRGAAPIHRAIEAGDDVTGATVMVMESELDSGPVLLARQEPIRPDDTTASLHDRLAEVTAGALLEAVDGFASLNPVPQDESGVTWAEKISPAEAEIDFTQLAEVVERRVRAFAPSPGAWFSIDGKDGKPQRIKVLAAEVVPWGHPVDASHGAIVGNGDRGGPLVVAHNACVELTSVQPQGKPVMDGAAFRNGYALPPVIERAGRD